MLRILKNNRRNNNDTSKKDTKNDSKINIVYMYI